MKSFIKVVLGFFFLFFMNFTISSLFNLTNADAACVEITFFFHFLFHGSLVQTLKGNIPVKDYKMNDENLIKNRKAFH